MFGCEGQEKDILTASTSTAAAAPDAVSGPPPAVPLTHPTDGDLDPQESFSGDDEERANPTIATDLRSITSALTQMVDDDVDFEDVSFPSHIEIEISTLFDFTKTTWVAMYKRSAHRSLDEELEFYKLADLDAEGDVDPTFSSVDETIDTILST